LAYAVNNGSGCHANVLGVLYLRCRHCRDADGGGGGGGVSITELRPQDLHDIFNSRIQNFCTLFNFHTPLQLGAWLLNWRERSLEMVLRKDQLEVQLKDEHQLIATGVLRDDSPLDLSPEFQKLCDACRIGDLKGCQEAIATGANINARDYFDYTPLILVRSVDSQGCCLH
jgi:hypothetical protein